MNDLRSLIAKNEADLAWPVQDVTTYEWIRREKNLVTWASTYVNERVVVVQAGGNCGLYIRDYAQLYDEVHTFEPDAVNFRCLVENVPYDNVFFHRAALGDASRMVGLKINQESRGATTVDLYGCGVQMMTLDSMNLARVDLIHYDIEGCELLALAGSYNTIKRCRPVVVVEVNARCLEFGHSWEDILGAMQAHGYRNADRLYDEFLFLPG